MFRLLLLLSIILSVDALVGEGADIQMQVESEDPLEIGHVGSIELVLKNVSNVPITILEIIPQQPCEEPISLIQAMFGEVSYDEEKDQYINDTLPQKSSKSPKTGTILPVAEGFLLSGQEKRVAIKYRPYGYVEDFVIQYASGGGKVYARQESGGTEIRYSTKSTHYEQVIIPELLKMPKKSTTIRVKFPDMSGSNSKSCFSTVLNRSVEVPPYSMYKEWDSGETVSFQVGNEQKGKGPGKRSAGWKFLDIYPVYYGDGVNMRGEFVQISPNQAAAFLQRVTQKFEIERVNYSLQNYYYLLLSYE
jgi:hypothetical protein